MFGVGLALVVVGGIAASVGGIWLIVLAFQENVLWGLGSLFVPFVSLIFGLTHLAVAKRAFLLGFGGLAVALVGLGLGGSSPTASGLGSSSPTLAGSYSESGRSFSRPTASPSEGSIQKEDVPGHVIDVTSDAVPADSGQKPAPGQKFAAVNFSLTNKYGRAVVVTASEVFRLVDSRGALHDVSAIGAPAPRFPQGIVAPSQSIEGWIAFQIPVGFTARELKFDSHKVKAQCLSLCR